MARLSFVRCVYALAALTACANAAITVYKIDPDTSAEATPTATGAATTYTGAAAYDPVVLNPPAPPDDLNRDFTIQVSLGVGVKKTLLMSFSRSSRRVGWLGCPLHSLGAISVSPSSCPSRIASLAPTRLFSPSPF
jgi:hypothetical protein